MRLQYTPKDARFWAEFLHQEQIGGALPGFVGQPYQRGAGIGSFFRSIFRMAAPVLKRAAKAVGKQALKTGASIIADVAKGGELLPSLEQHGKEAMANLADKASKRLNEAKTLSDLGVEDQEGGNLGKRKFRSRSVPTSINRTNRQRKVSRKKRKPRAKSDLLD